MPKVESAGRAVRRHLDSDPNVVLPEKLARVRVSDVELDCPTDFRLDHTGLTVLREFELLFERFELGIENPDLFLQGLALFLGFLAALDKKPLVQGIDGSRGIGELAGQVADLLLQSLLERCGLLDGAHRRGRDLDLDHDHCATPSFGHPDKDPVGPQGCVKHIVDIGVQAEVSSLGGLILAARDGHERQQFHEPKDKVLLFVCDRATNADRTMCV